LEIGVFTSTTTVALALLPDVEKIVALDIEPYLVEFAKPFYEQANVKDKIDFRIGDAVETLKNLEKEGQTFDMVFIDADKGGYYTYYEYLLNSKTLLKPDGLIVADNTIYKSSTYVPHQAFEEGQKALGSFNQRVRDDDRVSVVLLPVRDGISLIRRRVQ
jgi:predicted O-methyltransferase YrrM